MNRYKSLKDAIKDSKIMMNEVMDDRVNPDANRKFTFPNVKPYEMSVSPLGEKGVEAVINKLWRNAKGHTLAGQYLTVTYKHKLNTNQDNCEFYVLSQITGRFVNYANTNSYHAMQLRKAAEKERKAKLAGKGNIEVDATKIKIPFSEYVKEYGMNFLYNYNEFGKKCIVLVSTGNDNAHEAKHTVYANVNGVEFILDKNNIGAFRYLLKADDRALDKLLSGKFNWQLGKENEISYTDGPKPNSIEDVNFALIPCEDIIFIEQTEKNRMDDEDESNLEDIIYKDAEDDYNRNPYTQDRTTYLKDKRVDIDDEKDAKYIRRMNNFIYDNIGDNNIIMGWNNRYIPAYYSDKGYKDFLDFVEDKDEIEKAFNKILSDASRRHNKDYAKEWSELEEYKRRRNIEERFDKEDDGLPFYECKKRYKESYLKEEDKNTLTHTDGVVEEEDVSKYCKRNGIKRKDLKKIIIPAGVTKIGYGAFDGCSNLISVKFEEPNAFIEIGEGAFFDCKDLANIDIPESVKKIGKFAFDGCSKLPRINIPDGVRTLNSYLFAGCKGLKEITLLSNIINIRENVFMGCKLTIKCIKGSKVDRHYSNKENLEQTERVTIEYIDNSDK